MSINKFGTSREVDNLQQINHDVKLLKGRTNLEQRELVESSDRKEHQRLSQSWIRPRMGLKPM